MVALTVVYEIQAFTSFGGPDVTEFFARWIYDLFLVGPCVIMLARCVLRAEERAAWIALTAGLTSWTIGQVYYSVAIYPSDDPPYPSFAELGFLLFFVGASAGLVLLLRGRAGDGGRRAWLDGVIGALSLTAVGAAVVFPPVLASMGQGAFAVAVTLAFPIADLSLIGLIGAAMIASGVRTWWPIAAGMGLFLTADVIFFAEVGDSNLVTVALYTITTVLWPWGAMIFAWGAWRPSRADRVQRSAGRWTIAPPIGFAVVALALLVSANYRPINTFCVVLAASCLVALIVRLARTFGDNLKMLAASRSEALTDALTGLANRRQLVDDLDRAFARAKEDDRSYILAFFDLDGFKYYNDTFGHLAGDDLLQRLGEKLRLAMRGRGLSYRLGGDEFCVLIDAADDEAFAFLAEAAGALTETGEGFTVGCSYGSIVLPREADRRDVAMRIADQRMYGNKSSRRPSPGQQTSDVLRRVLLESRPDLSGHLDAVARHAKAVGEAMDLPADELAALIEAAALHDLGKIAIPDAILRKPGPLTDEEWASVRNHSVVGERIIGAAPALQRAARLVRASHERFDGTGYPDGLAGEDIPLGARIIAVCDAFGAMVSGRPHRAARSVDAAIAELRDCAGTQFDPVVVEVFADVLANRAQPRPATAMAPAAWATAAH
ncbi:diguanylate cyclase [Actinoplanes siamensis]|nr:diguanylate cyclase [Actinoplanes siamensis]